MTAKSNIEQLWEDKVLPDSVKKNVLESIETIQLLADMADLFTIKKFQAGGAIFEAMADSLSNNPTELNEDTISKKRKDK